MGRILFMVLAIFLLLGAFSSPIADGIKGWRTEDTTEAYASVTTAAGVTTANVTLANDLYQDDVSEVITITSNVTGESPVATSYITATKKLLVSALNAATTRTLTINYYAETDSDILRVVGPFLSLLVIGGMLVGILYYGLKRGRG